MGLHEIDEFSKIRSIYLSRKIINNYAWHPQSYLQGDGHIHKLTNSQTHRHIFSWDSGISSHWSLVLEKDDRWWKKSVSVLQKREEKTFDLCCNKTFASKIIKAMNALLMTSNGSGLKITEKRKQPKKCKIPGNKFLVWYRKKAIMKYHLPQEPYQVLSSDVS